MADNDPVRWMARWAVSSRSSSHYAVAWREAVHKAFPQAATQPTPRLTTLRETGLLSAAGMSTVCHGCIHGRRIRASFQHLGHTCRGICPCRAWTVEEKATEA